MAASAPMPRSPIGYPRVLARRLPPPACLGIDVGADAECTETQRAEMHMGREG